MKQRTCDELGVCQRSVTGQACEGTSCFRSQFIQSSRDFPFAPGVIDGGPKVRQTRALMWWALICGGLMSTVAVVAFAAGYLS